MRNTDKKIVKSDTGFKIVSTRRCDRIFREGRTKVQISQESYNMLHEIAEEVGFSLKKTIDSVIKLVYENFEFEDKGE